MSIPSTSTKDVHNRDTYIRIEKPHSRTTGFLSNSSLHGFTLDGKQWPSVEHYLLASKFSGTEREDEIRRAATVENARKLAKLTYYTFLDDGIDKRGAEQPLGGESIPIRKKVARGPDTHYFPREDWNQEIEMERALRAKFSTPRLASRLLATGNTPLVDTSSPLTGKILEKIRTELQKVDPSQGLNNTSQPPMSKGDTDYDRRDVVKSTLSPDERVILDNMLTLVFRIRDLEGQEYLYAEMVEDAILILGGKTLKAQTINWYENFGGYAMILQRMPNFERLIRNIQEIVIEYDRSQEYQIIVSALLASLIRWFRLSKSEDDKRRVRKMLSESTTMRISLPKIKRWYRSTTPPKAQRSQQKRKSPQSRIVEPRKAIDVPERLEIVKSSGNMLIVRGKTLPRYRLRLLSLGAQPIRQKGLIDEYRIRVPEYLRIEVEAIIFDDLPEAEKYSVSLSTWKTKKIDLFLDTAKRFAQLSGEATISKETLQRVIEDVYGCRVSDFALDGETNVDDPMLSPEAKTYLSSVVKTLESILVTDVRTYTEYVQRLESISTSLKTTLTSEPLEGLSSNDSGILRAISKILLATTLDSPSSELGVWAFGTLYPSKGRTDAEDYAMAILASYDASLDDTTIDETLHTSGVNVPIASVRDAFDVMLGFPSGDLRGLAVVGAAAISYISSRLKAGNSEALSMRVRVLGYAEKKSDVVKLADIPVTKDAPVKSKRSKKAISKKPTHSYLLDVGLDMWTLPSASVGILTDIEGNLDASSEPIVTSYPYISTTNGAPGALLVSTPKDSRTAKILPSTSEHRVGYVFVNALSWMGTPSPNDTERNREGWLLEAMTKYASTSPKIPLLLPEGQFGAYRSVLESVAARHSIPIYLVSGDMPPIKSTVTTVKTTSPTLQKKDLSNIDDRALTYYRLFSPHNLDATRYAYVVEQMEAMSDGARVKWLATFSATKFAERNRMLNRL